MSQDRTPGEPFVPKSSKEAEMEKILKSMEVIILSLLSILFALRGAGYILLHFKSGYARSPEHENVFKG